MSLIKESGPLQSAAVCDWSLNQFHQLVSFPIRNFKHFLEQSFHLRCNWRQREKIPGPEQMTFAQEPGIHVYDDKEVIELLLK